MGRSLYLLMHLHRRTIFYLTLMALISAEMPMLKSIQKKKQNLRSQHKYRRHMLVFMLEYTKYIRVLSLLFKE